MKRLLATLTCVILVIFGFWQMNKPEPIVGDFQLTNLPWPAYCDFYENDAMQSKGQALFASSSSLWKSVSIMRIDGEIQNFKGTSERRKDDVTEWVLHGNADYSVSFELRDSSDVPEIQNYSGVMKVRRKGAVATKNIIGRCSA